MDYRNHVVVKLADPTMRHAMLDEVAVADLLCAQYGARPDLTTHTAKIEAIEHWEFSACVQTLCADILMHAQVRVFARDDEEAAQEEDDDHSGDEEVVDPFSDLSFTEPAGEASSERSCLSEGLYPLSAALLVRDAPLDLLDLLHESKRLIEALRQEGFVQANEAEGVAHSIVCGWILPGGVFDDDAWPGTERVTGSRTKRRRARIEQANRWLVREGVAGLLGSTPRRER